MATLHVRNVPAELYDRLKRSAEQGHRSLSAEVIDILEAGVSSRDRRAETLRALEVLDEIARRNGPVPEGYAADLIREGRGEIISP